MYIMDEQEESIPEDPDTPTTIESMCPVNLACVLEESYFSTVKDSVMDKKSSSRI